MTHAVITIGCGRQNDILEKEIANVSKLHACNNGVWLTNVVLFNNLIHVFPEDGNDTDAILMFSGGRKRVHWERMG